MLTGQRGLNSVLQFLLLGDVLGAWEVGFIGVGDVDPLWGSVS